MLRISYPGHGTFSVTVWTRICTRDMCVDKSLGLCCHPEVVRCHRTNNLIRIRLHHSNYSILNSAMPKIGSSNLIQEFQMPNYESYPIEGVVLFH